jgi:SAM-dependent methyltransferase
VSTTLGPDVGGVGPILDPRGGIVRVIRALDRRGGLSSRRAERAYARSACLFRGLHARVLADTIDLIGDRAATVVDIGSGPGDVPVELGARLPAARIVGIEPSPAMRELSLARGVVALDGRAEAIPLAAGSADLVISTLSSHHWDDPVAAFREIERLLAPGGQARIYDVRFAGYSAREARAIATAAGLASERIRHRVLDERLLGLRIYARITIGAPASKEATP